MTTHELNYVELAAPDLPRSQAFYEAAFGWTFNEYGGAYAGLRSPDGEGEVGGLNPGAEAGGGGPLVLVESDDLDASVAAVREAGGLVVDGPYEYPGGRRFTFTDPAGNLLGVYQAG